MSREAPKSKEAWIRKDSSETIVSGWMPHSVVRDFLDENRLRQYTLSELLVKRDQISAFAEGVERRTAVQVWLRDDERFTFDNYEIKDEKRGIYEPIPKELMKELATERKRKELMRRRPKMITIFRDNPESPLMAGITPKGWSTHIQDTSPDSTARVVGWNMDKVAVIDELHTRLRERLNPLTYLHR